MSGAFSLNGYTCRLCRKVTITVKATWGTTPFMIRCRHCGGGTRLEDLARSALGYVPQDGSVLPTHEWYRPEQAEFDAMENIGDKDHVLSGGLLLREVSPLTLALFRRAARRRTATKDEPDARKGDDDADVQGH